MCYGNYCNCFDSGYFIYGSRHNGVKIMTDKGAVNVLKQIDDCISLLKLGEKKWLNDSEFHKKNENEVLERAYRKFASRQKFQIKILADFRVIFEKWATADNDKEIIKEMSKKFYELIDLSYF